jgi:Fe-Mn family superoxide dismutase
MAFKLAQQQVVARPAARPAVGRRAAVVPRAAVALKDPPYALDALEPHMSKQTLEFHWGEF